LSSRAAPGSSVASNAARASGSQRASAAGMEVFMMWSFAPLNHEPAAIG
jgi:hypothetical protein